MTRPCWQSRPTPRTRLPALRQGARRAGDELRDGWPRRAGGPEKARVRHVGAGQAAARDRGIPCSTPVAFPNYAAARRMYATRRRPPGSSPVSAGCRPRVRVVSTTRPSRAARTTVTVKKHFARAEVALHNNLPCVYLVDSGGAFLPRQDEVFPDREHFAGLLQPGHMSPRHRRNAAVLGSCTAAGRMCRR